jgi:hypothetical protein
MAKKKTKVKKVEEKPPVKTVPKNFMIRCPACLWGCTSTGLKADLVDLHEIKNNTTVPGRWRKFVCPKCGKHATMKRIR